jgi:hypothetical protein
MDRHEAPIAADAGDPLLLPWRPRADWWPGPGTGAAAGIIGLAVLLTLGWSDVRAPHLPAAGALARWRRLAAATSTPRCPDLNPRVGSRSTSRTGCANSSRATRGALTRLADEQRRARN